MQKQAILDSTKQYRYVLERFWGQDHTNVVNFILLNPSTADAAQDDPTVKACIEFARRWKFDGLVITNLFAFRSTSPKKMISCRSPRGDKNNGYIKRIAKKSRTVVVAWGNHGIFCHRNKEVLKFLETISNIYCLGSTSSGQPRHPLYVRRTTVLQPYKYR